MRELRLLSRLGCGSEVRDSGAAVGRLDIPSQHQDVTAGMNDVPSDRTQGKWARAGIATQQAAATAEGYDLDAALLRRSQDFAFRQPAGDDELRLTSRSGQPRSGLFPHA